MDSGSAVPTLSPGLRETVAAKLFTVARVRCGAAWPTPARSCGEAIAGAEPLALMLLRRARFLAALRLGRRIAATTARITITTSSSISVKARRPNFMTGLQSAFFQIRSSHCKLRRQPSNAHVLRDGVVRNKEILPRLAAVFGCMRRRVLTPANRCIRLCEHFGVLHVVPCFRF